MGVQQALAGAAAYVTVAISPATSSTTGATIAGDFNATATSNSTPSAYTWGTGDAAGLIVSGQGTSAAVLRITEDVRNDAIPVTVEFYCDMVVDGQTYRATCTYTYEWI